MALGAGSAGPFAAVFRNVITRFIEKTKGGQTSRPSPQVGYGDDYGFNYGGSAATTATANTESDA